MNYHQSSFSLLIFAIKLLYFTGWRMDLASFLDSGYGILSCTASASDFGDSCRVWDIKDFLSRSLFANTSKHFGWAAVDRISGLAEYDSI